MNIKNSENILLLGYGDIASRLADQLCKDQNNEYSITGVRRSSVEVDGVSMQALNILNQQQMNELLSQHFDVIVITMTPSEMSDEGYKKAYVDTAKVLQAALEKNQSSPRLIVFVSSTSVYGQQDAEWVNENSKTEPSTFSGQRLLEAESIYEKSQFPHCIVRFSGIYGPGRYRLIEQVISGHGAEKTPILYSNRIHADDCAALIQFLIEKQKEQTIETLYLGTDHQPAPLYDTKLWLAEKLSLASDHLQAKPMSRTLRSSKRCSNKRLLESGYQFIYPSYREGYESVLAEYKKSNEK